jgi:hypothetical protein
MIYEFRTYTIHPRSMPEFLKTFGEALPRREEFSKLTAFWFTEIGPLNQVIHVWGYKDINERDQTRAAAVKAGVWPPKTGHLIVDMKSEILHTASCSPELTSAEIGPYFEMRTYLIKPGAAPKMSERWAEFLPGRVKLSPLVGALTSDIGELNQWVHIWAYSSLDQRMAVRDQAKSEGIWPPPGDSPVTHQESKIMLAAPFSPIK